MTVRFYNTLTRCVEDFTPLEPGHVRMYTCGPTVYDVAHIGNFRAYVFEDLLRRTLQSAGLRVTQVMNLTDVDDKTIRGANEQGVTLQAFTAPFIEAFFEDLEVLRIERVEHYPPATDHIPEMIGLIERLLDRGYAYRSDDGSVYFSIERFADYGRLAHLDRAGLRAGARVAQDEYDKEHAADFALWKAWDAADGEIAWDSPWGRGRPGWHIECSAMSKKYLGQPFDIHTGGIDNIFPHHEDEIAQSEAAYGVPLAHTWIHCAHLMVAGHKMSKSQGNFYTLRDVLAKGYSGREVRWVLMAVHYRQSLDFSLAALDAARAALQRLDDFRARLNGAAGGESAGTLPDWAVRAEQAFCKSVEDDLNISGALAAVFDIVHAGHKQMDAGQLMPSAAQAVNELLERLDKVLGVLDPGDVTTDDEAQALLEQRIDARAARDWQEADRLRDLLQSKGWLVEDGPSGSRLKRV